MRHAMGGAVLGLAVEALVGCTSIVGVADFSPGPVGTDGGGHDASFADVTTHPDASLSDARMRTDAASLPDARVAESGPGGGDASRDAGVDQGVTTKMDGEAACDADAHACGGNEVCADGGCVACAGGDVACANECVDELTDSENCGGCGLACASCQSGECYVTIETTDMSQSVALDASRVYWTTGTGRSIKSAPLGGGTIATVATTPNNEPVNLVVQAGTVYFTNGTGGSVMSVPVTGGNPVSLVTSGGGSDGVAVDATYVYWTDRPNGLVLRVPLAGGVATTLEMDQVAPLNMVVDATHIFWTNVGSGTGDAAIAGSVVRANLDGGTPFTVAAGMSPWGIALDANNVYWTDYAAGTVLEAPIAGGAVVTLATLQIYPTGITVDATRVYWANGSAGSVMSVPIGGGGATSFQTMPVADTLAVAVNATSLYWTTNNGVAQIIEVTPK